MKKLLFFLLLWAELILSLNTLFSQTDSLSSIINDFAENETIYNELLLELTEQPVNINYADKDDFLSLPFITSELADSIIILRNAVGNFKSKRELRPLLGPDIYNLLKTYFTTAAKDYNRLQFTQRNIFKIENTAHINNRLYLGDPLNSYSRLKYQYNPFINIGMIAQKDPGEESYADHFNFALQYKRANWHVIMGNYNIQFAHGLSHSSPYGNQKSVYLNAVFREISARAKPDLSSSESSGKFGIFIQNTFKRRFSLFSFYSNAKRDVQFTDSYVSGIRYDGLHRTEKEMNSKEKLSEQNWGLGVEIEPRPSFKISLLVNQYHFSEAIEATTAVLGANQKRRQKFSFAGKQLSQASLYGLWKIYNLILSAELSASDLGSPGWTQAAFYSKKNYKIGLKYWYLDKKFQSIDGRSFDSTAPFPNGTKGFFGGTEVKFSDNSILYAYKKIEYKIWRTYFDPMPTASNEWLARWEYHFNTSLLSIQMRHKMSEDYKNGRNGYQLYENNQNLLRLQLNYKITPKMEGQTRWEHTQLENTPEQGTLTFQDINYKIYPDLHFSCRLTFFYTSSYNSRIYEYERDLPGAFSNSALFDNGHKFYSMLFWQASEKLAGWLKLRYILKAAYQANGKPEKLLSRDWRLQIRYRF